jgi:ribonuclease VapC
MTIDTSALIAVLFSEAEYLDLVDCMLDADHLRMGAPTLVEASIVFAGRAGRKPGPAVADLVKELGIAVAPFAEKEWHAAAAAFQRFGRGRHRASLNFGDCLAYAAAATADDSLLFTGNDFRHTDIRAAL